MGKSGLSLKSARVLLGNDDGIHAPGLKCLERTIKPLCKDLWVSAPEHEQSGAGHSLTIRNPLRIRKLSKQRYAVDGTPTDAVLLGVHDALGGVLPDLMLSGVNRGGNLGEDVTYSGTVAAAMEATLLGIPAVALSLVTTDRSSARWGTVEHWLPDVLNRVLSVAWPGNVMINVNFPDVPADKVTGIEVVAQGRRKLGSQMVQATDPRGDPYFWIGSQRDEDRQRKGSDLEAVTRGAIAITPLCLDLTHKQTLRKLKDACE